MIHHIRETIAHGEWCAWVHHGSSEYVALFRAVANARVIDAEYWT